MLSYARGGGKVFCLRGDRSRSPKPFCCIQALGQRGSRPL